MTLFRVGLGIAAFIVGVVVGILIAIERCPELKPNVLIEED